MVIKKVFGGIGTFLLTSVTAGALTYFLIPEENRTIKAPDVIDDTTEITPTDHFTDALIGAAAQGISGTLGFEVNVPVKGTNSSGEEVTSDNIIGVSGGTISFLATSFDDLALDLYAPVSYNGKTLDLNLNVKERTAYFSLSNDSNDYDVKYKFDLNERTYVDDDGNSHVCSQGDYDILLEEVIMAIVDDGNLSIPSSITSLTSSVNTDDLMADFGNMESVKNDDGSYMYYLSLHLGDTLIPLSLGSNASYSLTSINLPGYKDASGQSDVVDLGNGVTAKFNLSSVVTSDVTIKGPEDASSYHRLMDSLGLFKAIRPLVNEKKFGFDLDSELTHVVSEATTDAGGAIITPAVNENTSLDFTANINANDDKAPQIDSKISLSSNDKTQQILIDYLTDNNGISTAYLNLNEALKAKMSKQTLDEVAGKMSSITFSNTVSDKTVDQVDSILDMFKRISLVSTIQKIENGVTSIIDSDLIGDVKAGHYETALDVIESIVVSDNKIVVTLNLSPANVTGKIVLTIDSSASSLAKIDFQNIVFASFTFSGTLSLVDFAENTVDHSSYSEMSHLPYLADQVSSVVGEKRAAFTIDGSVMDGEGIGFEFDGDAMMNVNPSSSYYKSGTGTIVIADHKAAYTQNHTVNIDVVGTEDMFFTYNSGSEKNTLKGRFTIQTLNDIISLIGGLIGNEDARYTKFMDQMTDMIAGTVLGDLVDNNLNSLIENNILVSSSLGSDSSQFVISKNLIGTDSDITVGVAYGSNNELSKLSVSLVSGGKTIKVNLGVSEYTEGTGFYRLGHTKSEYMDFSQLSVLMAYGLKTSEMNTYHITASGSAKVDVLPEIDAIDVDLYVYVNGATAKIYGSISISAIGGVNAPLFRVGTHTTSLYYSTDSSDMSGTLYLDRYDKLSGWNKTGHYYKKVKGADFLNDMSNWLLGFVFGLEDSIMSQVTSSSSDTSRQLHFEDVLTSFDYNQETSSDSWDVVLDMGALSGQDALKNLTLNISGGNNVLNSFTALVVIQKVIGININLTGSLTNLDSNNQEIECWSGVNDKYASYISSHSSDAFSTSYVPSDFVKD